MPTGASPATATNTSSTHRRVTCGTLLSQSRLHLGWDAALRGHGTSQDNSALPFAYTPRQESGLIAVGRQDMVQAGIVRVFGRVPWRWAGLLIAEACHRLYEVRNAALRGR